MKKALNPEEIQWFEPEDGRKALMATLTPSGRLYLGKALREQLPGQFRVGFRAWDKTLIIQGDEEAGIPQKRTGIWRLTKLSAQIQRQGLPLPLRFLFEPQPQNRVWYGQITPRRKPTERALKKERESLYCVETLLKTHGHLIDTVIIGCAKTTPLEERRSIAAEAFLTAAAQYREGFGDLSEYLFDTMRAALLRENKAYTAVSGHERASLDGGGVNRDADAVSLYTFLPHGGDDFRQCDRQLDEERFLESLSALEREVYALLTEGFRVEEITRKLDMTQEALADLCERIGSRRRQFDCA